MSSVLLAHVQFCLLDKVGTSVNILRHCNHENDLSACNIACLIVPCQSHTKKACSKIFKSDAHTHTNTGTVTRVTSIAPSTVGQLISTHLLLINVT